VVVSVVIGVLVIVEVDVVTGDPVVAPASTAWLVSVAIGAGTEAQAALNRTAATALVR